MLLKDFISGAVSALENLYAQNEAKAIVFRLCEDVLGTKNYTHIVEPDTEVDRKRQPQLEEMLARLADGEPLQYVTGHAEFCGFDFAVTPDVLIPRPETELLCRHAVEFVSRISRMRSSSGKFASPVRVLDLCTGSGCIAWTIALSVPGVEVVATDISEKALDVARSQNFRDMLKADHEIKAPVFVHSDVLDTEARFEYGDFDLITSNPPYVRESEKKSMERNVLEHEPAGALFVPDEDPLLYYRAISSWSRRCLAPEGMGLSELNEVLAKQTEEIFSADGFMHTSIVTDLNSKNRILRYSR
ncbi:MAG: peptide chain release factor N(5)-glutamine methyltransferase [Bacteroidetes bacterium]|uniref:peptide chain release factor N(5)-glutamine methyltransferase n=1 Tax=Candidatus Cryptobacteroides merdavium TaxID=2840769 RepID=A0A9D9HC56_9BACT|nr:peptide chain release factor N(5)-glutamine methyltransferase [Candidatus Cryptobacteroides merdavium]